MPVLAPAAKGAAGPSLSPSAPPSTACLVFPRRASPICAAGAFPQTLVVAHEDPPSLVLYRSGGEGEAGTRLEGHTKPVFGLDYRHERVFSASADGTVRCWKGGSEQARYLLSAKRGGGACWAVAAHAKDPVLLMGGEGDRVQLCAVDRPGAAPLQTFAGHRRDIEGLKWSPTAPAVFLSTSLDETVKLWDVRAKGGSGPVRTLYGQVSPMTSLALSPDGRLVTTGSCLGVSMTWDLGTQRLVHRQLLAAREPIYASSYDAAGRCLQSCGSVLTLLDSRRAFASETLPLALSKVVHIQSDASLTWMVGVA
jgi:WD40 repeat protein